MLFKPIRSVDLVSGGNIIKQGEKFKLSFRLFDEDGKEIDVTGKTVNVKIANNIGVIYETAATIVGSLISFSVTENIGHGEMRVELKVTDSSGILQKYPSDGWISLKITPSLDDLGIVGVNAITVQLLKNDLTKMQNDYKLIVGEKLDSMQSQISEIVAVGDSSVEAAQARVDETGKVHPTLKARIDDGFTKVASHEEEMKKVGLDYSYDTGNTRGMYAVDLQHVRIAPDQVAGAQSSFIAGGEKNKIQDIPERDSEAYYSHASGLGNRAHDWGAQVEGYYSIVDGKISHAEGNAVICTANDSHAEGNRSVAGRRYYGGVTYGSEDAGDGLGVLNYVLIPPEEGDVSSFFPNALTDNIAGRYGAGTQKDVKGNIYPTNMTPAVWSGNTPTTPNDLKWAMHPFCIVRGTNESSIEFVKIAKTSYSTAFGTKVYYFGANPYGGLIGIYSSYAPTVVIMDSKGSGIQGGNGSHAEGLFTSAFGYGTHSEGSFTRAWGHSAHAEGRETKALANYSHAEGYQTIASGLYSHAEGHQTEAVGESSFAGGSNSRSFRNFQRSYAVGKMKNKGDNQLIEIQYTKLFINAGWHPVIVLDNLGYGKAYHFETMVVGRQISGSAGKIGDTFAYKFSGCVIRNSVDSYEVIGTPKRELIGRSAGMAGDGLTTGTRISWDSNYLTSVLAAGAQKESIYLRMDGVAFTDFQVTTSNKIQEMGL